MIIWFWVWAEALILWKIFTSENWDRRTVGDITWGPSITGSAGHHPLQPLPLLPSLPSAFSSPSRHFPLLLCSPYGSQLALSWLGPAAMDFKIYSAVFCWFTKVSQGKCILALTDWTFCKKLPRFDQRHPEFSFSPLVGVHSDRVDREAGHGLGDNPGKGPRKKWTFQF